MKMNFTIKLASISMNIAKQIVYIKHGRYRQQLARFRNLESTRCFEGTKEKKVCIENIPVLSIDPDDSIEDKFIIVDQRYQAFEVVRTDFSIEVLQRKCLRIFAEHFCFELVISPLFNKPLH